MQILVISDIHSNYPALQAVAQKTAQIYQLNMCLTVEDSLVYAPFPNETLELSYCTSGH